MTELPDRPNLQYLQHAAKDLLRAARSGDAAAATRLGAGDAAKLADAQLVIAREHGFANWAALRAEVERRRGLSRRPVGDDDHLQPTTAGPATFLATARQSGWTPGRLPDAIVFVFQGGLARRLETHPSFDEEPSLAPGNGRFFISVDRPVAVGVSCLSPGATAMVTQVENQLALGGATQFVLLNLAGGLGPDVTTGEVAVVETAVRDDAISDHYLPPGDTVDADSELTDLVEHALRQHFPSMRHRISWTTPAIYRQTAEQLAHYTGAGVSLVESEIASLFAVTRATGATAAAVVVTTSGNTATQPETATNHETIAATQHKALDIIIDTLSGSTGRNPSSV